MLLFLTIRIVLKENKVPERFLVSFFDAGRFCMCGQLKLRFFLDFRGAPVRIENSILFKMAERS